MIVIESIHFDDIHFHFTHPPTHCCTKEFAMKLSELATEIAAVSAQVAKVKDEVLARIAALEAALQDLDLPESVISAFVALREGVQALDDVTPDLEPVPEPEPQPEPIPDPV